MSLRVFIHANLDTRGKTILANIGKETTALTPEKARQIGQALIQCATEMERAPVAVLPVPSRPILSQQVPSQKERL